ncbi:hypothetical protein BA894_04350 [Vibrio natriegens]|uniref:hypothetical protein n=1 Tax=Vibrio natriegens TaxID=691 RepID=UPI000804697E|nr:hypothetical protein [Vibrio natriegens]ANQ25719.1 hypothetical protein BA894_04350 [Vibrio natriegens]
MRERLILKRGWCTRKFLVDHRDWWLPIFTTFIGVFLAASLTIYFDKSKSDATVKNLLKISLEDICAAWLNSKYALEKTYEKGAKSDFIPILPPEIMKGLFKQNATILGDFHPKIAIVLVRRLSEMEVGIESYNGSAYRVQQMRNALLASENNSEVGSFKNQLATQEQYSLDVLKRLEYSLAFTAHALSLELSLRDGEFSSSEIDDFMDSKTFGVPCNDKYEGVIEEILPSKVADQAQ